MSDLLAPPSQPAPSEARGLELREVQLRAETKDGKREFSGIAVPWNDPVSIRSWFADYTEEVERGAVQDSDDAKVFWRHSEPIGRITRAEDTDAGWEITGVLSATPRGDEAYTLLRDGVIDRMSIGFEPIEHREVQPAKDSTDPVKIIRTKIRVREVSLVPFPAYDGATVDNVRHANPTKEKPMTATTEERADTAELRAHVEEMDRKFERIIDQLDRDAAPAEGAAPPVTYRSAGAILKAIADGDEDAAREYQAVVEYLDAQARDWSPAGSTTGENVDLGGWVGDLTRIVTESSGIRNWFASAPLPTTGMTVEYGTLTADTTQADKQTAEGASLPFGKVTTEVKNAPVDTYGGYSSLSKQTVQRASVNVVNHTLTALSNKTNRALNIAFRAAYAAAVTAAAANAVTFPTAGNTTLTSGTVADWISVTVDAAEHFEDQGVSLDGLIVDSATFKYLAGLQDDMGNLLMNVYGEGVNRTGEMNLPGLSGNLLRVTVIVNLKQAAPGAAFANKQALRSYISALTTLTAEDIVNLANSYSIYAYGAFAPEFPDYIVPVAPAAA